MTYSQIYWALLCFAINFDQSVVDDFLSSTAFFTASAAEVVACVLCAITVRTPLSPPSSLHNNVLLTQSTGYRVQLTTIYHQFSRLGSKGPKSMARKRSRDPSDLGAFLSGAQRGLPLSLLRYHTNVFLDTKGPRCGYLYKLCYYTGYGLQWNLFTKTKITYIKPDYSKSRKISTLPQHALCAPNLFCS